MEQLEYNLLFRWFVGLNMDETVWVPTVFTKNRDRLLEGDIAEKFFAHVLAQARSANLLSDEHFSVDGTLFPDTAGVYGLNDPRMVDALYPDRWWLYLRTFISKGILDRFYATTLADLAPIRSVLDLACGLNPLSIPWMPLAAGAEYYACDIYGDMVDFLNRYLALARIAGLAQIADLTRACPNQRVDVALLNEEEAKSLAGETQLVRAADRLLDQGASAVIVKKGEHGALYRSREERFITPAYPVEALTDPTGAGDSFAGGFIGWLARCGRDDGHALRQAEPQWPRSRSRISAPGACSRPTARRSRAASASFITWRASTCSRCSDPGARWRRASAHSVGSWQQATEHDRACSVRDSPSTPASRLCYSAPSTRHEAKEG